MQIVLQHAVEIKNSLVGSYILFCYIEPVIVVFVYLNRQERVHQINNGKMCSGVISDEIVSGFETWSEHGWTEASAACKS